jgi:hypothetical protein
MRLMPERMRCFSMVLTMLSLCCSTTLSAAQVGSVLAEAQDVTLENGTILNGVVTDRAGNPVPNSAVRVLSNGSEIATTQSDAAGRFSVGGMREGEHVVEGAGNSVTYRLWRPDTAPPGAVGDARLIVDRGGVVYEPSTPSYQPASATRPMSAPPRRGFLGRAFANYPILTAAGLLGAGIGSGIAIGSNSSSATP